MNVFLRLMASSRGRLARVALGSGLIGYGLGRGAKAWPLTALGLLPLAMGALDLCLLAPLSGLPLDGDKLRKSVEPPLGAPDYYTTGIGTL